MFTVPSAQAFQLSDVVTMTFIDLMLVPSLVFLGQLRLRVGNTYALRARIFKTGLEEVEQTRLYTFAALLRHVWLTTSYRQYHWPSQLPVLLQCLHVHSVRLVPRQMVQKLLCVSLWQQVQPVVCISWPGFVDHKDVFKQKLDDERH